ncbi:hypothetical protein V3C99_008939 [Haemonchus contortus]|uniref:Single-stranded DNA-binding protein n=1 Tax=Haemonchus contortus TaxID=6289 RepID=A0A7I4YJS6_HAECO
MNLFLAKRFIRPVKKVSLLIPI